jgi:hypothetical protein
MTKITRVWLGVVRGGVSAGFSAAGLAQRAIRRKSVETAYQQFRNLKEGQERRLHSGVAKVDPNLFGIVW